MWNGESKTMRGNQDRVTLEPGGGPQEGMNLKQRGDDLLTVAEVAEWLRLSRKTVYAWAASGKIPRIRIGNRVRFRRCDVLRLIRAGEEG
jgi:excisionase family DNA binding protein